MEPYRALIAPVSIKGGLPLPAGAATAELQVIANQLLTSIKNNGITVTVSPSAGLATEVTLSAINAKVPALGQALAAASVPVVLTAAQLTTLTPLSSVSISNFPATQAISAVSLPLPTGASTSALQAAGNASLSSIDAKLTNPLPVSGPLTDAELRATPVPVSGTVTATIAGVATEATLSAINAKVPALGQALAAASVPVVLTAAQLSTLTPLSTVAVTGPLTDAELRASAVPISAASLPLPSGASTSANQVTANASLASIDTKLTAPLSVNLSDGQQLDAFGRLRVSYPDTIFDNNFRNSLQALLWSSSTATGGTITHTPNSAAATLAVTAANGSSAVYQTRRYFPYNAGKSQFIIFTGVFGAGQANTRKRYGYFDANDGIFFELNGTALNVVRRTATSGAAVDNTVAQASWNLDPLNGTGPSGFTLDVTRANIFFIDFEWLGVGRIRMGVANPDGGFIYCHEFINANQFTVPYMRTGSLPVRAEITNTAGAAGVSSLVLICQTVISEGGSQRFGTQRSASRGFTLRTVTTAYTPLISMRLKAANITAVARLVQAGVFGDTADNLNFSVIINPTTLTGATWALTTDGETVEADIAATALTGGTAITHGYVKASAGGLSTGNIDLETALNTWLGSNLAGTADVFTLAARCSTGTADVAGFLTWLEL
jgi:hypothetical protein